MQTLIRQLERARWRARWMLLAMRVAVWLSVMISAALAAGLADYMLRLPGWLRLGIGVMVAGGAMYELIARVAEAARVKPALTSLALRLERVYPQARGRLASAVAFASGSIPATSTIQEAMSRRAEAEAEGVLDGGQVARLLDPTGLLRKATLLAVAAAAMTGVCAAAPDSAVIALDRWTRPLGDARWPNRYTVVSATRQEVAPNNAPLAVNAQVTRGDHTGLRTWVSYQFLQADGAAIGAVQRVLMTRQPGAKGAGEYQRLIEPASGADRVQLRFEAGDDQSDWQTIRLITPPSLRQLVAQIDPPGYAASVISAQRQDLLNPPRPAVVLDVLEGSRLRLMARIEGSFRSLEDGTDSRLLRQWATSLLGGLADGADEAAIESMQLAFVPTFDGRAEPGGFELSWTVDRPTQFHFRPTDEYGTTHEDPRQFRLETRADRPPRATILQPAGDETVLPTAVVELAAEAQDDVAVAQLDLQARPGKSAPIALGRESKPAPRSRLGALLDLATLKAQPGQEIAVVAVVRDNFLLHGRRHDPVESTARILRFISPEEMSRQIRTDLADLRQRATRAQATQQRLIESAVDRANTAAQQELTEQIESMTKSVQAIQQRLERNKLDDPALQQTLRETAQLTTDAAKASVEAAERLARAARDPQAQSPQARADTQAGRSAQQQAKAELDKLVQLLDQGRDAYELQQKLVKLAKEQGQLSSDTRQMMGKTLGRDLDQLSEAEKNDLKQTADRQDDLAQQARQISDRMRSTAAAISRQSDRPEDQAMAEAMRQAADTATSESLDQKMLDAARQAEQNRLAQSQSLQQQAQQVLQQMLEQLGKTDKLRQEILQRRLMELAEAIRKLVEQQQAQLERLQAAARLDGLDEPVLTLRRNTLSISEQARSTGKDAEPVAELLDAAAAAQSDAAAALRAADGSKADAQAAEQSSLAKLEQALKLAEALANKAQNQESEKLKAELLAAYDKARTEQIALRQAAADLSKVKEEVRDRKWRSDAVQLGNRQADLRVALDKIRAKLSDTIVYQSVHDQIDGWTGAASTALRRMTADAKVLFNQQMVIHSIEALVEALKQTPPDEQFATSAGSPGGGEQQGAGQQPLVPPIAELKLLRGRQDQVHRMTRTLEDPALDADSRRLMIQELSRQQDDLAATGAALIQSLQQPRMQNMPLPIEPMKPDEPEKKQ